MADGGREHIRGAYIIQHLIEGAGWKDAGSRKKGKMHQGDFKREEGMEKKREMGRLIGMAGTKWKRER